MYASCDAAAERRERAAGEADRLAEGVESVRELQLVALRSSEELDSGEPFGGRRLDRVERVDEAGRVPREARVEAQAMHVHGAFEGEVVVERDRAPVELQENDSRNIRVRESEDRLSLESASYG